MIGIGSRTWLKSRALIATLGLALFTSGGPSNGAALAQDSEAEAADRFDIDLFAPAGPAFVALGASPHRVAEPGALQDFKIDFGSIHDGEKSRLGAAFSIVPYWLGDRSITLTDYRTEMSRLNRILARTQASLGIARAGGDDTEALRLGFGLQTQLLDGQDHRFDEKSYQCIHAAWTRHRAPVHDETVLSLVEALQSNPDLSEEDLYRLQQESLTADDGSEAAYLDARKTCRDEAARRLLAKPSWQLGFGVGTRSEEENLGGFDYDGLSVWTSYRQPIGARGRFAVFGFARGDFERVFDFENDLRAQGNGGDVGLGGAYQSPHFRLDLSAAQAHRSFTEGGFDDDNYQRYSGVADVRLREGIWLGVSGGTVVNSDLVDGAYGSVNLKVAWGDYLPFGR